MSRLPDSGIDGDFVRADGTIRVARLLGVVLSGLLLAVTDAQLLFWDAFVAAHVRAVGALGAFLETLLAALVAQPAAVQSAAWATAFERSLRFGPLGPLVLAAEAILVAWLVAAAIERRPRL